jgi:hypothetical protein
MWSVNRPDGRSCNVTPGTVPAHHPQRQLTTLTSVDALSERHCAKNAGHGQRISPDTSAVPYSGREFGYPISP